MEQPPARSPQKFVSPATWEAARADYLAGDTAAIVAARYGIGIDNLRKRQIAEGWTRKAQRAARGDGPWPGETAREPGARRREDRPPDLRPADWRRDVRAAMDAAQARVRFETGHQVHPATALSLATGRAATLVAEGRGVEAQAVIKAAESLSRLTRTKAMAPAEDAKNLHAREARLLEWQERTENLIRTRAVRLMATAFGWAEPDDCVDPLERAFLHALLSDVLEPDRAAANREAHRDAPWAEDVWDETGAVREQAEIDRRTLARYRDDWRAQSGLPTDAESWARAELTAQIPDPQAPAWLRQALS